MKIAQKRNVSTLSVADYQVLVTRKKIQNMYLRVRDAGYQVEVSAPYGTSDKQIKRFVTERLDWIAAAKEKQRNREELQAQKPVLVPFQEREMRQTLKKQLEELISVWEPRMGVKSAGFTIKKMKTRWGSCNVQTHHLNFNFSLAQVPQQYVEYVVVHELTHLLEPSHNERFWQLMEQFLPGSRRLRRELNHYQTKYQDG